MNRVLTTDAFSLLELNFKQAVAFVLNKPQWWTQWHDPAVRGQWLAERRAELLRKTFDECLVWKQKDSTIIPTLDSLELSETPRAKDSILKNASTRSDDGRFVFCEELVTRSRTMNAYLYVQWYFAMTILQKKLTAIPVQEWSLELIELLIEKAQSRGGPEAHTRFFTFLHSMLEPKETTGADAHVALGEFSERHPCAIELLRSKCQEIQRELARFEELFIEAIDFHAKHHLTDVHFGDSETAQLAPAGIYRTWVCDDAIPAGVMAMFVREVGELEREISAKDSGSNPQELNLIDPSLFCCVCGTTRQVSEPYSQLHAFKSPADQMATLMFSVADQVVELDDDLFQWIPSEFQIQHDGAVRILSYINNLHPVRHAAIYTSIEAIFSRFVPLFERVLTGLPDAQLGPTFSVPSSDWLGECRPEFPASAHAEGDPGVSTTLRVELRGTTIQVVVKVSEIRLAPDTPAYNGGMWHIEGTNAENIVATGLYCFASENIKEGWSSSRVSFRVLIEEPEFDPDDHQGVALMYNLQHGDELVQELGSVDILKDRCLVFPNDLQHKLEPFELNDLIKPGVVEMLAFFLVDPEDTIPSAAVIPPQQQTWIDEAQEPILKKIRLVEEAESTIREMICSQRGNVAGRGASTSLGAGGRESVSQQPRYRRLGRVLCSLGDLEKGNQTRERGFRRTPSSGKSTIFYYSKLTKQMMIW